MHRRTTGKQLYKRVEQKNNNGDREEDNISQNEFDAASENNSGIKNVEKRGNFQIQRMFTLILWLLMKLVNIFYIPLFVIRPFKKSKKLPPIDNRILLESATELAEKIRNREITAVSVIKTYIKRIKQVNPIINAVIDDRFPEAITEAENIDKLITSAEFTVEELKRKYPLLGVPLTVKGSISIAGLRNSSGLISKTTPEPTDAIPVHKARNAGAIPLLTSNVPELCLNWESTNKLIGTTKNPYNTTRTSGGSSGGEAAILGSAGSVIGIGSDIAGSLRLPGHFCGVYGHKPTPGTVSFIGHYPHCTSEEDWKLVFTLGPMARYAKDLRLLFSTIIEEDSRKSLQLDNPVDVSGLNIFYMDDVNSTLGIGLNRSVSETLQEVVRDLDKILTTKCSKVRFPLLKQAAGISYLRLIEIDGVDNLFPDSGEGALSELFRFVTFQSNVTFSSICYGLLRRFKSLIPQRMQQKNNEVICTLQEQFHELLDSNSVLILPSYPTEAPYHRDSYRSMFHAGVLSIFNTLGLPACNCPVKIGRSGLPIGVQIVAAPYCDRLIFSVAEKLEEIRGGWKSPSGYQDLSDV